MRLVFLAAASTAASLLLGSALPAAHAASSTPAVNRTITVSADGTVLIVPDVAYVTVGVVKTDIDAARAQAEANAVATKTLASIQALGIPARDIQTAGVTLDPQYDDHNALTGFQATDTLAITVEHLNQTGPVIDAAVHSGANHALGISFGLKDTSSAQASALKAAVHAAQAKAAVVASQFGVSLTGAKFQVVENSSQQPQPFQAALRTVAPTASDSTPVQAGSLTVQDNVTITYTL